MYLNRSWWFSETFFFFFFFPEMTSSKITHSLAYKFKKKKCYQSRLLIFETISCPLCMLFPKHNFLSRCHYFLGRTEVTRDFFQRVSSAVWVHVPTLLACFLPFLYYTNDSSYSWFIAAQEKHQITHAFSSSFYKIGHETIPLLPKPDHLYSVFHMKKLMAWFWACWNL